MPSYLRNSCIASRLALAFGGMLIVFAVFGGLVALAMRAIDAGLTTITDVAQPIRVDSFEMEINTLGAGLGVVMYLQRPHPEHRARFEKDKADFEHFLAQYRTVAKSAEDLSLADKVAEMYRQYADLGDTLMRRRDAQTVRYRRLVAVAHKVNRLDDVTAMAERAINGAHGGRDTRLALALAADMVEIFFTLANSTSGNYAWSDHTGVDYRIRVAWLDGEIGNVRRNLNELSKIYTTPAGRQWVGRFSELFEQALALTWEIELAGWVIEQDLTRFIEARNRIDTIHDDQIQILANSELAAANSDVEAKIKLTYWLLFAIGALGITVAVASTGLLSRTIVRPIRQLVEVTHGIAAGDLSRRASVEGRDEIGDLGRAFNNMTEALESALSALNQSNTHLEAQVTARTSELATTNRQLEDELALRAASEHALRIAKEAAEVANHGKTVFLTNMSHELRTPLNAIIGFAHLIGNETFGPMGNDKYMDYIKDIESSAQGLLKLIDDILGVARLETGNLKLREEWIEIASIAKTSVELLSWKARGNSIALSLDIAPGLPRVWADELRIKQAMTNLLDNAIKFTLGGGEVAITVALAEHGDLEVSIRDNGIGIPPEGIEKAFTVFGQVDAGLDRRFEGAGLGLPLAKEFVELHGGEVTLESVLGQGTHVRFTLPRSRLEDEGQSATA